MAVVKHIIMKPTTLQMGIQYFLLSVFTKFFFGTLGIRNNVQCTILEKHTSSKYEQAKSIYRNPCR